MKSLTTLLLALSLSACSVAQQVQYSALEKVGVHKRDILVNRIEKTSKTQQETKEQFKSAYEELATLISIDDQGLEAKYKKMASAVKRSEAKADELSERINSVDRVANDIFNEWEGELDQYQSTNLRNTSARNLNITKQRYASIYSKMRASNALVEPVLQVLQDNTLFLKHNLNARAVTSISNDVIIIEDKVKTLIRQMEASINESKTFIDAMQSN